MFGAMPCTGAAPAEHFNVLNKQSYEVTPQRLPTKVQETVVDSESAMCRVQGTKDAVGRNGCEAAGRGKRQNVEQEKENLMRDGIRLAL